MSFDVIKLAIKYALISLYGFVIMLSFLAFIWLGVSILNGAENEEG